MQCCVSHCSACVSVCRPCLPACVPGCLSVCLPVCSSVHPPICQSVSGWLAGTTYFPVPVCTYVCVLETLSLCEFCQVHFSHSLSPRLCQSAYIVLSPTSRNTQFLSTGEHRYRWCSQSPVVPEKVSGYTLYSSSLFPTYFLTFFPLPCYPHSSSPTHSCMTFLSTDCLTMPASSWRCV